MGNLEKVWLTTPDDMTADELREAFSAYFGAEWNDVLDTANQSFLYNAANDAYFSVRGLRSEANLSLEQLLEEQDTGQSINIVVS